MVCTAVTTICGVWLAYGEPPNLIMKANLHPYLDNAFFLATAGRSPSPAISSSRGSCAESCGGQRIDLDDMDVIDANAEDVRFLQATRHGEVHDAGRAGRGPRGRTRSRPGRRGDRRGCAAASRSASPWSTRTCPKSGRAGSCSGTSSATNSPTASTATTVLDAAGDVRSGVQAELAVDEVLASHGAGPPAARRRLAAFALVPFIAHARSCTASTTRCRCFSPRSPGSLPRCPAICAHPEDARAGAARGASRNTPSTTSCFRCFCRSRC